MAWSDAARRAAAMVRAMRKLAKRTPEAKRSYHTANVGGRVIDVSRQGLGRRIRAMRKGLIDPDQRILNIARVSQGYKRASRRGDRRNFY